ncbi:MAG: ion transporter [Pseudomonadota bacterium]
MKQGKDPMTVATKEGHDGRRAQLRTWLESSRVRNTIMGVIVFNAISLGASTSPTIMADLSGVLGIFDTIVIAIFIVEMVLKLYAYGLSFFRSAWNIFDLAIVTISVVPTSQNLSVLRALRIIRAMRLLSGIPQMRKVIVALLDALPGMGAVVILLALVYYIYAVMATLLFGEVRPERFGTIGESLYSLFQIMTLESWSMGIVRPVMEDYPQAWLLFVPFITMTAFAVLNLFIGLLVNTMQAAVEAESEKEVARIEEVVEARTAELRDQIAELKTLIEQKGAGQ